MFSLFEQVMVGLAQGILIFMVIGVVSIIIASPVALFFRATDNLSEREEQE